MADLAVLASDFAFYTPGNVRIPYFLAILTTISVVFYGYFGLLCHSIR
jgi:hypothetical protein